MFRQKSMDRCYALQEVNKAKNISLENSNTAIAGKKKAFELQITGLN